MTTIKVIFGKHLCVKPEVSLIFFLILVLLPHFKRQTEWKVTTEWTMILLYGLFWVFLQFETAHCHLSVPYFSTILGTETKKHTKEIHDFTHPSTTRIILIVISVRLLFYFKAFISFWDSLYILQSWKNILSTLNGRKEWILG